jgi:hypothetical protein
LAASPRYRFKRLLRRVANYGVPNSLIEFVFGNILFRRFAQLVFFHHRGLLSRKGWGAVIGKEDG